MEDKKYTHKERLKLNRELKPEGKKCCSKCEQVKTFDEYYQYKTGKKKGIYMSLCIECGRRPLPDIPFTEMNRGDRKAYNERLKSTGKKCCKECGEIKPLEEFASINKEKGYRSTTCCYCAYWTRRDFLLEYNKQYWREVRKFKTLTEEERKSQREYHRQYRLDNAEMIKEWKEQFKENNPSYHADYRRERRKVDPEFHWGELVMKHVRTVKNRQDFIDKWEDTLKMYDEKGITYNIDHMVPRNWFKMDTPKSLVNHIDNLQVIDAQYNQSKQDRWSDPVPSDYLDKIRPYIKKERLGDLISL